MDFHQLGVFVEVARLKNFSRAAEKMYLTQPTVSAHIKALENEIGAPLFDRYQRCLQLTSAGKVLFQYAQELLNLKKRAFFAIQQEQRVIRGHLEIAASSVPSAYVLPGLMKGFLVKHPEVTFAMMHRDTRQVFSSIKDFTYELGFVGEPINLEGITQIKLTEDTLVLVTTPGMTLPGEIPPQEKRGIEGRQSQSQRGFYAVDLKSPAVSEAIQEIPFILREPGSATRLVFENALKTFYRKKEVRLNVVAYMENQEAIKEAVKTGLGVAVISTKAVQEEVAAGLLKGYQLPDLRLERNLYLIRRSNCVFSPLYQAFLDHCLESFGIGD